MYETTLKKNIGKLPPECYDTIDGYLDPRSYVIKSYQDGKEIRRPDNKERSWIIENCRVGENLEIEDLGQPAEEGDDIHPIHQPAI